MKGLARRKVTLLAVAESASSAMMDVDLEAAPERRDLRLVVDVTGTISGIVIDSAHEPVADAQVTALPDFFAGNHMEGFDLRGIGTATTDGGGRFVISGLADGPYRMKAGHHQNRAMLWQSQGGVSARPGDSNVEIVVQEDGRLIGVARLDTGGAPSTFTVAVQTPPGIRFADSSGKFSLPAVPAGTYDVTLSGPDFADHVERGVEIEPGKTTDLGTITVRQGRFVTGRVVDANGKPIAGATVVVGRKIVGDGRSLSLDVGTDSDQLLGLRRGETDAAGQYRINGIAESKLVVAAEQADHGRSLPREIPPGRESPNVDLQLVAFGSVVGRVTSTGKPAGGVQVIATPKASTNQNIVVMTSDVGMYQFERLPQRASQGRHRCRDRGHHPDRQLPGKGRRDHRCRPGVLVQRRCGGDPRQPDQRAGPRHRSQLQVRFRARGGSSGQARRRGPGAEHDLPDPNQRRPQKRRILGPPPGACGRAQGLLRAPRRAAGAQRAVLYRHDPGNGPFAGSRPLRRVI
jgi:hypothetical protein